MADEATNAKDQPEAGTESSTEGSTVNSADNSAAAAGEQSPAGAAGAEPGAEVPTDASALDGAAADLAAERLADLQRLQAEYVNYKRRVDRDRDVAKINGVNSVLESLLPVLDDIYAARGAGDLVDGPFAAIAEKLETTLTRFELERYGEPGDEFDPAVHEALVHTEAPADMTVTTTTVVQILQPGYRCADRVLRPARVAVADPS